MSTVRFGPFPAASGFALCLPRIPDHLFQRQNACRADLIVQEGQQAQVETGQSVITGVDATETATGSTQFQNMQERGADC